MINKKTMGDLKFTMLGNTATHMPQGLGGLPGMTAMATHQMRKTIADLGVPRRTGVPAADRRLRRSSAGVPDVGGHAAPGAADLHDEVEAIIRASDFIEKTDGAQLLFI